MGPSPDDEVRQGPIPRLWRGPSRKVHGKVFARKRDAEAFGRLMEAWKAEGSYFDPGRGEVTPGAFVLGARVCADAADRMGATVLVESVERALAGLDQGGRAAAAGSGLAIQQEAERMNNGYLPEIYMRFRERYPDAAHALDALGAAGDAAGPLDERICRLVDLGIAVGAEAEGAVRSNARRALAAGATREEIRQVALLAISTRGFPAAIAGLGWIDEVLSPQTGS